MGSTRSGSPVILLVSYHFWPENASGTHRSLHFARSLHDAGHRVHVLTVTVDSIDNPDSSLQDVFPFDRQISRVAKATTLGDVYLRLRGKDNPTAELEGRRRPSDFPAEGLASSKQPGSLGFLRRSRQRLAARDTLPDVHRAWYRPAVRAGLKIAKNKPVRAVFASGPPWTALRVGRELAGRIGCPFVADFRDPWTARTGGADVFAAERYRSLASRYEDNVLLGADCVTFNSPQLAEVARLNCPEGNYPTFEVILNGSDAPRRSSALGFPMEPPLVVRHFGSLYRGRSIGALLRTVAVLMSSGELAPDEMRIELYGYLSDTERGSIARLGAASPLVTIHDSLPHSRALEVMREPSVLLAVQPGTMNHQVPTKVFEYLCTGNPVLILAERDSAVWGLAQEYARCSRLSPRGDAEDAATLGSILSRWRHGDLVIERTVEDTAHLTKTAVGEEFVELMRRVGWA